MDAVIQTEIDRIKAGPQSGWFTFLHHEGPIIESSSNVMERVEFIVAEKRQEEILIRLQHIYSVPKFLYDNYEAKCNSLYDNYVAKCKFLYDGFLALIPNCKWNGKTILKLE